MKINFNSFPTYKQSESKDCGPTCIKILGEHYGKLIKTQELWSLSKPKNIVATTV
jgi:ATP-binding cassette subfamily B protein